MAYLGKMEVPPGHPFARTSIHFGVKRPNADPPSDPGSSTPGPSTPPSDPSTPPVKRTGIVSHHESELEDGKHDETIVSSKYFRDNDPSKMPPSKP